MKKFIISFLDGFCTMAGMAAFVYTLGAILKLLGL